MQNIILKCRREVVLFVYKVNYYIFFVLIDINNKISKGRNIVQWCEREL